MRLKRLSLKNYGRHREETFDFHQSLTAITGPNGSGKSTLFSAIIWALTGENATTGVKEENICDTALAAEVSWVSLEFFHNGVDYAVTRHLRPTSKKASLAAKVYDKPVQGDNAVTQAVLALLGVDSKVLRTYSIVQQGELFTCLSADPAERSKLFQRLFGTERCAEIARQLAKHRTTVQLPSLVDEDASRAVLTAAEFSVKDAERQVAAYRPQAVLLAQRDDSQRRIDQEQQRTNLQNQATQIDGLLGAGEQQFLQLKTQQEQAANTALLASTIKATATGKAIEARHIKARYEEIQQFETRRQQLQLQQQEIAIGLALLLEHRPQTLLPGEHQRLLSELEQSQGALQHRQQQLTSRLRSLSSQGTCPTCGRPSADIVNDDQQQLGAVTVQLSQTAATLQSLKTVVQAWGVFNNEKCRLEQFQQQLAGSLAALPVFATNVLTMTAAACEQAIADEVAASQADYAAAAEASRALAATADCQRCLDNYRGQLSSLRLQLSALPQDQVNVEQLFSFVIAAAAELEARSVWEANLARAVSEASHAKARLEESVAARLEYDRRSRWLDLVGRLEELFHYNGLPKIVSQDNLLLLERSINSFLQLLEADFRVTPTPDLMFDATFRNGVVRHSRRLSYGQMGVLGLAFMLAVNFQFLGQLGILMIDEPTAWLDAQRVEALLPTLLRLRDASTARSLQIVVVTHEESLRPAFNHVIALASINNA